MACSSPPFLSDAVDPSSDPSDDTRPGREGGIRFEANDAFTRDGHASPFFPEERLSNEPFPEEAPGFPKDLANRRALP
jgi:hypothetical protein